MSANARKDAVIGDMEQLLDRLYPICRSLTGDGVRETLRILGEYVPLAIHEVPSGTQVFDWTVPPEWNIRDAYILDPEGRKIVDFQESNLHVVGYSTPIRATLSLEDLRPRLHSLPDQPDAVPYLTSYYQESWGFCLTHRLLESLTPGNYTVAIDSTLAPGSLTYGEAILEGEEPGEILLATNICHPSLANHEICGPIVAAFLYQRLAMRRRRYTYRFLFNPETIGAIAYLKERGGALRENLVAGYTLLCLGMGDHINYKTSRRGTSIADTMAAHILRHRGTKHVIQEFIPFGSDERQFCSPGFNLPVGSFRRGIPGCFPQYHTSLDKKDAVCFESMAENVDIIEDVLRGIDAEDYYISNMPYGEPQLGKRGLYRPLGSQKRADESSRRMLFVMNYADGEHALHWIADKAGCSILDLLPVVENLSEHGLIRKARSVPDGAPARD